MTVQPLLPVVSGASDDSPLDRALALDGVILPHAPIALAVARRLVPWWRALQRNAPANTVRALWADARHYIRWCGLNGRVAVPAGPETVIAYLTALSKNGGRDGQPAAYGTVARRKSTIATLHEAAGLPDPCKDRLVQLGSLHESAQIVRDVGTRRERGRGCALASPTVLTETVVFATL